MKTEVKRRPKAKQKSAKAPVANPRFAEVVAAFGRNKDVMRETGKGFGSGSLKVTGKIFSMMSSKGEFVVKLPGKRVDELVQAGQGKYFDPGRGRLMKEWFVGGDETDWIALAKEAHGFVGRSFDKH